MVLCSVFGCNSNNDKKRATFSQSENINFYSFTKRSKSPLRFIQWLVFCKRKDFAPGSGSRISSKHFQEKDFTESSNKLYLNSDSIPTIYKVDDLRPKTPRSIRISRKRNEEDIISKQNSTSISVKKLKVDNFVNNFNESDSEEDNVLDIDNPNCIYFSG